MRGEHENGAYGPWLDLAAIERWLGIGGEYVLRLERLVQEGWITQDKDARSYVWRVGREVTVLRVERSPWPVRAWSWLIGRHYLKCHRTTRCVFQA